MATWSLRQRTSPAVTPILSLVGAAVVLAVWWSIIVIWNLKKSTLPTPIEVVLEIPKLAQVHLLRDISYSMRLNVTAYIEAVIIAVPLGFVMGLFGPIRSMFLPWVLTFRFVPITAFVGIFIRWFGIGHNVKIQFLVFGVLVYLLPTVIQRVDEVEQVYLDTAKTCGASRWQRITTVFWPLVAGRLSDDLRSLVAITWTYIVIAEGFNLTPGGLGAMVNNKTRASEWAGVFVAVVMIASIGFAQDWVWRKIDRRLFAWKY